MKYVNLKFMFTPTVQTFISKVVFCDDIVTYILCVGGVGGYCDLFRWFLYTKVSQVRQILIYNHDPV